MRSKPVKALYIVAGSIALILGAVGIVIPLLPTTPFLLLAAFCYTGSSKRLYNWLLNHRIFGFYIHSYITLKAIDRRTKLMTILMLWGDNGPVDAHRAKTLRVFRFDCRRSCGHHPSIEA